MIACFAADKAALRETERWSSSLGTQAGAQPGARADLGVVEGRLAVLALRARDVGAACSARTPPVSQQSSAPPTRQSTAAEPRGSPYGSSPCGWDGTSGGSAPLRSELTLGVDTDQMVDGIAWPGMDQRAVRRGERREAEQRGGAHNGQDLPLQGCCSDRRLDVVDRHGPRPLTRTVHGANEDSEVGRCWKMLKNFADNCLGHGHPGSLALGIIRTARASNRSGTGARLGCPQSPPA